ncbi:MAG: hypothetical protein MZU79_01845 [Anaerotruncus sp.]|nr:hypothetical protein [Anaerotruncus sp.]
MLSDETGIVEDNPGSRGENGKGGVNIHNALRDEVFEAVKNAHDNDQGGDAHCDPGHADHGAESDPFPGWMAPQTTPGDLKRPNRSRASWPNRNLHGQSELLLYMDCQGDHGFNREDFCMTGLQVLLAVLAGNFATTVNTETATLTCLRAGPFAPNCPGCTACPPRVVF